MINGVGKSDLSRQENEKLSKSEKRKLLDSSRKLEVYIIMEQHYSISSVTQSN